MKCESLSLWKRSLSIPSNILEGFEKDSVKDKKRYINIDQGTMAELTAQVFIGIEIGYIDKEVGIKWHNELHQLLKLANRLKRSFK